ncbi:hypothetical protein HWQ46_19965 [Shewanella sp. D64]|uniref:hypothetical protein n=1 Tax=unclassified Shewanella TaxID=196818 RepID=UPI0022BA6560|nr:MULTISPECIES: hypothetical protein [unclassified Shewanella]MEC4727816.1 hypothetical protein [Shewanella sp. D64]MEC4739353.1 hypothetical protein [Shewanella sp. E94]WBJ96990.1 hypothetical protein HWQ47_07730 [Shewanella sp. MTB7]
MPVEKWILDLDYMHNLVQDIKASNSATFIYDGIKYALQFYDIINFEYKYENSYIRARMTKNEQAFTNTSEIYYPPLQFTNVGRVNEKGDPFLYLSLSLDIALAEIGAKEGDVV